VSRLARILLLAALTLGAAAPAASAAPTISFDDTLGALWTKVLETSSPQNPYGGGDAASACWDIGGTLAPLAPPPGVKSCTVKPNTPIYVTASTYECSTFPGDQGSHPVFGTTEAELRACAHHYDAPVAPTVTVDGNSVPVTEVETTALTIALPGNNIFGLQAPADRHGVSVAHGWVTLLQPLTSGTQTIVIRSGGSTITTTVTVTP
jgi:hypothetical protein